MVSVTTLVSVILRGTSITPAPNAVLNGARMELAIILFT